MPVPRYPWIKNCRVGNSIIGFWIKLIVFVIERLKDQSDHEKDWIAPIDLFKRLTGSIHSWSIFLKDQQDRFAHGGSFFQRSMRGNQSHQSLKKIEEQRCMGAICFFGIERGKNCQKQKINMVFLMELLLFCDRKINSTVKKIVITLFNLF